MNQLRLAGEELDSSLKAIDVLICYLYQDRGVNGWEWKNIYPIRRGKLLGAYKSGSKNADAAHFYFSLEELIDVELSHEKATFLNPLTGKGHDNQYARVIDRQVDFIATRENARSAFHQICDEINLDHLRSPEREQYFPVFCSVDGLKNANGKILKPKYDPHFRKSYYTLAEGARYSFSFSSYVRKEGSHFRASLFSEDSAFSNPEKYEIPIECAYDEESWTIVPSLVDRSKWTMLRFNTDLTKPSQGGEALNLNLGFLVRIRRRWFFRFTELVGEIGFGVGTGAIALSKQIEASVPWWYWIVLVGYGLWIISRLLKFYWRG